MKVFKRLKQLSSLALLLCVATQVQAADVDLATAQKMAKSFMTKQVANGRLRAAAASNLKLAKAEASVFNPKAVDYYIFNADKSYVVVAGDDLAPEILMYGEEGTIDINDIPPAMQWVLNKYKYQIDGIKAGTLKPNNYTPKATTAVAPLVTANWDQSAPYNNQCPTSGSSHALTGCPATSLAMCYYRWKWPKTYPAVAAISSYNGIAAAALPEREADWDNIIDEYTGPSNYTSTSAQKDAVAWLMRYAGQAIPDYMYGTSASGANDPEIYQGVKNMGYTDAQYYMLTEYNYYSGTNSSQYYTDAQWNEWMLTELYAGRPIEYLAYDSGGGGGHAFNVFGCNTSGQYYVNWGWSGDSNGYCTLHNFTTATGATGQSGSYVFNYGEAMIIGIEPPAGALGPQIIANPTSLEFEGYAGETYTQTINVKGYNLEENITIAKSGSSVYSVSPTTITPEQAENGVDVTVTYKPTAAGNTTATLTLSSGEAEAQTVTITGVAKPRVPTLVADPTSLSFVAKLGKTVTKTINLTGVFLTGNVTATLTDPSGVFSVSPATIAPTSFNGETPLQVAVSFMSNEEANYTGSLTFASNGAESVTVQLTAMANDGGTASDPYLDIAKYETIDEAGFSSLNKLYNYTEYPEQDCAWLTVSNYGMMANTATQKWFTHGGEKKYGTENWSATDVFLGNTAYFSGSGYYANWNEDYQTFYVTNCSQVKQFAYNSGSTYPLLMDIYECTLNADGSIVAGTTSIDHKTSTQYGTTEIISSIELNPEKIYKVAIYNDYSRLYEIGFRTPYSSYDKPVATVATDVTSNSFTANWSTCTGATSYTLRVQPFSVAPLMSETFAGCTASGTQSIASSLNNYCDNAGWTGTQVYQAVGGLRLGTGSATGNIVSPAVDLSTTLGKVYVLLKAKTYTNNNGTSDTNCNLTISCGSASETVTVAGADEEEFLVALDCTTAANQNIKIATTTNKKRVVVTGVEIYNGEPATGEAAAPMTFTGITGNSYEVTGLNPETTYIYDVKAIYGTDESGWSNQITVTTLAEEVDPGITLAELLSTGVDGEQYTISNDLAVADVADYVNNAFLTDGEGNWIMLTAEDEIFNSLLNMNVIKGGTLKATLSGIELNPVLTATAAPEAGSEVIPFEVAAYNLADTFDPKVNQVIDVTGFWRASEGAMRAYSSGGQSMTLNTSWGASNNTLVDGKRYTVRCAMNIKEAWKVSAGLMPKDYDYDFQNYLGYALRLPDTPTAITTIGADGNEIVNVYNVQGMLLKQNIKAADALKELPRGIYIIGNRKVIVK
ncbi:MAG: C10 family peptidase [Bacteroidales bacterium]|nr:C10 family peptidase [Bacteroidales bacterium]